MEVRAPLRLPHAEIVALLNQRADWLWKHLDRLSALAPTPQLAALQQLWLLGPAADCARSRPARRQPGAGAGVRGARDDAHAAQLLKQRYRAMAAACLPNGCRLLPGAGARRPARSSSHPRARLGQLHPRRGDSPVPAAAVCPAAGD